MKLEELKKIVDGMTFKSCSYEEILSEEATLRTYYDEKHRAKSFGMLICDTGKEIPEYVDYGEAHLQREDAIGIAMLRNHAELFIKLLEACKESERKWTEPSLSVFSGLVPLEFQDISDVIREIEDLVDE